VKLFGFNIEREKRSNSISDPHFWVNSLVDNQAGITPEQAMRITAVLACVKVISETLASLPLFLYRRLADGGKEIARDHQAFKYLHNLRNTHLTPFEMRELLASMLCLRGNSYAQVVKSFSNKLIEIVPLNPAYMKPEKVGDQIIYRYNDTVASPRTFMPEEIWHIKDTPDVNNYGLVGTSRISQSANAINLARYAEEYGLKYFQNDTTVGMALKHPGKLSAPAKEYLKTQMAEFKTSRRHDSIVLEEGLTLEKLGLSNEDSQFIESRHLQVEEIARIFRVPCVLIGYPDKASTYASVEQFMLSFIIHTIRPWCVRIEQSMNKTFLTEKEQDEYFWEHKLEGMLRGDMAARFSAYSIAKSARLMTTNEIRALENLNPIPGEDKLDETPNMIPAGKDKNKNEENNDGK